MKLILLLALAVVFVSLPQITFAESGEEDYLSQNAGTRDGNSDHDFYENQKNGSNGVETKKECMKVSTPSMPWDGRAPRVADAEKDENGALPQVPASLTHIQEQQGSAADTH